MSSDNIIVIIIIIIITWVVQGGFRTGFHKVGNCKPPSKFMVSSLYFIKMASVVLLQ